TDEHRIPRTNEEQQHKHHHNHTGYDVVFHAAYHLLGKGRLIVSDADVKPRRKLSAAFRFVKYLENLFRRNQQVLSTAFHHVKHHNRFFFKARKTLAILITVFNLSDVAQIDDVALLLFDDNLLQLFRIVILTNDTYRTP